MSTISPQQAINHAKNAGFSGISLATIVAIAMAESGLQTDIRGKQDPRDRGVLQINSYWHPDVSDQCAFDPQCAFNAAYKISSNGSNFSQWTTYKNGAYKQYLTQTEKPSGVGDPCLSCGPVGSAAYNHCVAGKLIGIIDPCAGSGQVVQQPNTPGAVNLDKTYQDMVQALSDALIKPIFGAFPGVMIRIGLFMGALMFVVVGMWILTNTPPTEAAGNVLGSFKKTKGKP